MSADFVQVLRLTNNPRPKAEELREYELGYRTESTKTPSLDAAVFVGFYRHLQNLAPKCWYSFRDHPCD